MTAWAEDLLLGGGYVLLALLILLENLFPPIPSELLLPLAGSRVASGDFDYLGAVARPPSAPSPARDPVRGRAARRPTRGLGRSSSTTTAALDRAARGRPPPGRGGDDPGGIVKSGPA